MCDLLDFAALLDDQYSKNQSQQRNANNTDVSNGNGNNSGQQGILGNGLQGPGFGNGGGCNNGCCGRGCGNGGHGFGGHRNNQGCGSLNNNFIEPERWNNMSWEEHQAILEARNRARSANNANMNSGQDNDSTIVGLPTTVNVANGVDVNNNGNRQTNMTTQASQGSINPGTMICNMMSSTSARSTNISNGAHQDEITVNGTTYCSINAATHHCMSQQANNNKVCGALVDRGANGGLLGDGIRILEHILNGFVNVTGIAGNKLTNLKLAQAAALMETMADGAIIVIMSQPWYWSNCALQGTDGTFWCDY